MLKALSVFIKSFRFNMPTINNNNTVVVVLGATGTGKSKLAIEIATKYQGEVINADSMQIYKGLDIATNKVSEDERLAVPHHMLDFLDPMKFYNVVDFRNATLPIIKRIHNDGKVPVIVGGTHYYVESILWNVLVSNKCISEVSEYNNHEYNAKDVLDRVKYMKEKISEINININTSDFHAESDSDKISEKSVRKYKCPQSDDNLSQSVNSGGENSDKIGDEINSSDSVTYSFSEMKKLIGFINSKHVSNEELLLLLGFVDSEIASSYHPNNRRKIIRSLEVWIQTGVRHSEHIRRQSSEVGGADLGGRIRFENVAILWVTCDQDVLVKRLDDRVDLMMQQGLLKELSDFYSTQYQRLIRQQDEEPEKDASVASVKERFTKGIFQCIGFKEFGEYLKFSDEERETDKGKASYQSGITMMKVKTRQYSKSQLKWIRNRFFRRTRMKLPVYAVDGTDPLLWKERVSPIAEDVVSSILSGKVPSSKPASIDLNDKDVDTGDKTRHFCDVCNRVFIGNYQWEVHVKSERHRKVLNLKRKSAKEEEEEDYETKVDEKCPKVSL